MKAVSDLHVLISHLNYAPEQGVSQSIYGYVNTKGEMVITPQYSSAGYFINGLAQVSFSFFTVVPHESDPFTKPETHLINPKGEIVKTFETGCPVCSFNDDRLEIFIPELMKYNEGLSPVQKNSQTVTVIISLPEEYGGLPFSGGRAQIYDKRSLARGYIDTTGTIVIPIQYKEAEPFSEGVAVVRKDDNRYMFINSQGGKSFPGEFDHAKSFSDGLAPAALRDKTIGQLLYGFIDSSGNWVIKPVYRQAESFSDGFALVADYNAETGYTWYFISTKGENMFKREFKSAARFFKGFLFVTYQDPETEDFSILKAVIDTNGKNIWNSKNNPLPEGMNPLLGF